MEEFGKAMKLDCQTIGADSCTSRFIAVSACTFSYGIAKSEKTVKESIDIADDLHIKSHKNFTLKHSAERIKIYTKEGFRYKIYPINLKPTRVEDNAGDTLFD